MGPLCAAGPSKRLCTVLWEPWLWNGLFRYSEGRISFRLEPELKICLLFLSFYEAMTFLGDSIKHALVSASQLPLTCKICSADTSTKGCCGWFLRGKPRQEGGFLSSKNLDKHSIKQSLKYIFLTTVLFRACNKLSYCEFSIRIYSVLKKRRYNYKLPQLLQTGKNAQ